LRRQRRRRRRQGEHRQAKDRRGARGAGHAGAAGRQVLTSRGPGPLPAGGAIMSTKADFSAEEWKLVLKAPLMAGLAVVAASPSGPLGVLREMFAVGK